MIGPESTAQASAAQWAAAYRRTLLEDIVPFWLRHALDPSGALNNCLDDSGRVLSRDRIPLCCELACRHLEAGCDAEYGGLYLALDVRGRRPVEWCKADCKPWWAQVEALVTTAYAWEHTGTGGAGNGMSGSATMPSPTIPCPPANGGNGLTGRGGRRPQLDCP